MIPPDLKLLGFSNQNQRHHKVGEFSIKKIKEVVFF